MTTLATTAFDNLQFLTEKNDFLANRYKIVGHKFIKEDDDTIYTLQDLEYPLFFTFHQLMNHIHSSYEQTFRGKTKREILSMFNDALDVINEYYVATNNSTPEFEELIDDIDDKIYFIRQYYKYGWCLRAPTIAKDTFSWFCKAVITTSRSIMDDMYIEMKDPGLYDTDDDGDDGDDGDDDTCNDTCDNDNDNDDDDADTDDEDIPDLKED